MNPSIPEATIDKIASFFEKESSVLAVYLMGSAARSSLRHDSDVDLGIVVRDGCKLTSIDLMRMLGELGYEFGYDFDLGLIDSSNLVYAKEAILKGKRIYMQNPIEAKSKVNYLLSMYYNFAFERKEVLNAYRS